MFVGINPSVANAGDDASHFFGGFWNQFYRLVAESGKSKTISRLSWISLFFTVS
jgi:G:T/U-mismatch repair DNA glycosylase